MTRPDPSPPATVGPPPRVLVAVAVAVLAVTTVLVLTGAVRAGIGTDEPVHVMRLRNLFATGWYGLDWDFGAGSEGGVPGGSASNVFVYGPVAMLLLHAWGVVWGTEAWGQVGTSEAAYQVRHVGVALLGLAGVAATAGLGRVLLRGWRWGLVAAAALAALPVWTGNAMLNIKDTPVATGHTLVTLGLVLLLRRTTATTRVRWARAGCLAAGLVLALGTRPGMWPGLLVVLVVTVVGIVVLSADRALAVRTTGELGAACLVAAGVLVASYPNLFGAPLRAVPRTTEGSSRLLAGTDPDRWYLPRHLAEDLPTLLGLFALTGLATAVVLVATTVRRRLHRGADAADVGVDPVPTARLVVVAGQAATLPLAAVVAGSDLYHGLRQVLFVLPALAVLAVAGMAWWLGLARVRGRVAMGLVAATAAAALVLPTVDQVTLQPYQTTYVNLASDLLHGRGKPADDLQGGDNWRVSLPELVDSVRLDRQLLCKAYEVDPDPDTDGTGAVAHPFANGGDMYSTRRSVDCREEPDGPLAPAALPVRRSLPVTTYDAVFIGPVPVNCSPTSRVTRWRHGFEVVVSTLARCRVPLAPLGPDPVRADDPEIGTAQPGDLWLYAVDGWLQWPGRDRLTAPVEQAGLGFTTDDACAHTGCTLRLAGRAPADLVAQVDGQAVRVGRRPGTVRVPVAAGTSGAVRVDLHRRSGAPLDVVLTAVSLVPSSPADQDPTTEARGEPSR